MKSKCILMIVLALFIAITNVVPALCIGREVPQPPTPTPNHVAFMNLLDHNKNLKVHCKSKDKDLGVQIVSPFNVFRFDVGDDWFYRNLFQCDLWQGPNDMHHMRFIAYDWITSPASDELLLWIAKEDGVYFTKGDKQPALFDHWDVHDP